jgi:hypothetical protein
MYLLEKYSGQRIYSLPHYQQRAEKLYYRFRKAGTKDNVNLEGVLYTDSRGPYLSWEFEDNEIIRLNFQNADYKKFINHEVAVIGKKKFPVYFTAKEVEFGKEPFFGVSHIEEKTFDWMEELRAHPPIMASVEDYLNYYSFSKNEKVTNQITLALIGFKDFGVSAGIGLTAYTPKQDIPMNFKPILDGYNQLDSFKLKNGAQKERYSDAFLAHPNSAGIIERTIGRSEIDYLAIARSSETNALLNRVIALNSELFGVVTEDGLVRPRIEKEMMNDIKYGQYYANKFSTPAPYAGLFEDVENARKDLEMQIMRETSTYQGYASLLANKKIQDIATVIAKAKHQRMLTSKDVLEGKELLANGFRNLFNQPGLSDLFLEASIKLEEEATLKGEEGAYKRMSGLHENIQLELMKEPQSMQELKQKLYGRYPKKAVDEAIEFMIERGHLYERDSKFYFVRKE